MLQKDFTEKLLQLPLNKIKIVKGDFNEKKDDIMRVRIRQKENFCKCPYCQRKISKRYDKSIYLQENVNHLVSFKYKIVLDLEKRRFYCDKCQKSFHEKYDIVPSNLDDNNKRNRSCNYTNIFVEYVLCEWTTSTAAEIARKSGVSESTIWKIIDGIDLEALKARGIKYLE